MVAAVMWRLVRISRELLLDLGWKVGAVVARTTGVCSGDRDPHTQTEAARPPARFLAPSPPRARLVVSPRSSLARTTAPPHRTAPLLSICGYSLSLSLSLSLFVHLSLVRESLVFERCIGRWTLKRWQRLAHPEREEMRV